MYPCPIPPKKYVALPLARVYCRDETYTLTDFIPPALAVERQSQLGVICSWTARRLREKAMYLADQLRLPAAGARAGADREAESLIRSLVASLPLLEAVLGAGASHPYIVYLALCSVAGQVSVMGRSLVPPEMPDRRTDSSLAARGRRSQRRPHQTGGKQFRPSVIPSPICARALPHELSEASTEGA